MAYATRQDIVDFVGEQLLISLTDTGMPRSDAINEAVLSRALDDASAEIDSYLAVRYSLPLAAPPAILRSLALDISKYRLWKDTPPENVRQRFKDAREFLTSVSAGKAVLDAVTKPQIPVSAGGVAFTGNDRTFTKTGLTDY